MQRNRRPSATLPDDLHIHPSHPATPSCPERLHRRLFRRKPPRKPLIFILESLTVLPLRRRIQPPQKGLPMPLNRRLHPPNLRDVNTQPDDQSSSGGAGILPAFFDPRHASVRQALARIPYTEPDSCFTPDCDYTGEIVATVKTSPRKRAKIKPPKSGARKTKSAAKRASSKDWTERTHRGVTVVQATTFNKIPWLVHGFSTRPGGVSEIDGEKVLNLGAVEWDSRENVEENRRRFQSALGATDLDFVSLHQIHSDVVRIFNATATPSKQCKGDALATNRPGLLLGVRTADCSPVLVVDPKKRVVAAIHAGWRGTLARIVVKTIGQMQMEFKCNPKDLLAAIGPTIGGCCYEVGTEVAADFSAKFSNASEFFDELRTGDEPNPLQWLNMMPPGHQPPPKKVLLDLKKANRLQLLESGLRPQNIFVSDLCTSCHVSRLFSYRKESSASGRLLSVIALRPK